MSVSAEILNYHGFTITEKDWDDMLSRVREAETTVTDLKGFLHHEDLEPASGLDGTWKVRFHKWKAKQGEKE